ncbi:MAG: hypothetical protein WC838_02985, partial [Candidatus Margulisiibacteriota bacterium]
MPADLSKIHAQDNYVLLETLRRDKDNKGSLLFKDPYKIVSAPKIKDVLPALKELNKYVRKGYYAAGYIAYEASFALDGYWKNKTSRTDKSPLLWFGIYKKPVKIKPVNLRPQDRSAEYLVGDMNFRISQKEYAGKIKRIKKYIEAGDVYQVNFTSDCSFN